MKDVENIIKKTPNFWVEKDSRLLAGLGVRDGLPYYDGLSIKTVKQAIQDLFVDTTYGSTLGGNTSRILNSYGQEGWELVAVFWAWHYMKRTLQVN